MNGKSSTLVIYTRSRASRVKRKQRNEKHGLTNHTKETKHQLEHIGAF